MFSPWPVTMWFIWGSRSLEHVRWYTKLPCLVFFLLTYLMWITSCVIRANHQHNVLLKNVETEQQETKSMPDPFFLMLITAVTRVTDKGVLKNSMVLGLLLVMVSELESRCLILNIYLFSVYDSFSCMIVCVPSVCSGDRDQKKVWDPLEWEPQMVIRSHMSTRNPTRVLCKGRTCSLLLSHFSSFWNSVF